MRSKNYRFEMNKERSIVYLDFENKNFEYDFAEAIYSNHYRDMETIVLGISQENIQSLHSVFSLFNKDTYPQLSRILILCKVDVPY